jgi:hypothetical protein
MQPVRPASLLVLLLAVAAACGGANDNAAPPQDSSAASTTAPAITVTTPEETADPTSAPTGKPTFNVTLTGQDHSPVAGTAWKYTVHAASKDGGSAGGTAKMRIFVDDQLVDTLGYFAFDDTLTRTHQWPKALRGRKAVLQAEVEGDGGTQRANWPVEVR